MLPTLVSASLTFLRTNTIFYNDHLVLVLNALLQYVAQRNKCNSKINLNNLEDKNKIESENNFFTSIVFTAIHHSSCLLLCTVC